MEEFLQRTRDCLVTGEPLQHVHAVLGDKSCDLDSITGTLAYAYYLEKQVNPLNVLCVPVLNIQRSDFFLHVENGLILDHLKIPSECLIFRDEIDLQQLNREGKLILTLLSSNVLTSDDKLLESAVVKVIRSPKYSTVSSPKYSAGRQELPEFISATSSASYSLVVLKEILQKAPDLVTWELALLLRGVVLLTCTTSEEENAREHYEETLSLLENTFPQLPPREEYFSETEISVTKPKVPDLSMEQILLKDVKELSDGEIKVAISSVYMTHEDNIIDWIEDMKAFIGKYDYEALIILATYVQDGSRKIVVHTENLELGSQVRFLTPFPWAIKPRSALRKDSALLGLAKPGYSWSVNSSSSIEDAPLSTE
ncbi:protein prune homolog 2-like [Protopterus annectens]|uniref:protein prune homolog 2-like n=1 Tax=Protopterus annectens TaxID=7888 RepID=UPI001CFBD509|nr:protein prune homolog 2-like [Protopterus annectens]